MEGKKQLSDKNVRLLIEWLEKQGFTSEKIKECLKFITKKD